MSLEDLDLVFAVRKRSFMQYQVTKYLPWFFRHYFLANRDAEKPPLYNEYIWKKHPHGPNGGDDTAAQGGVVDRSRLTVTTVDTEDTTWA